MKTQFNVKLSAAERARLEEHRIALGLRCHADVVRYWIGRVLYLGDQRATTKGEP